MPEPGPISLPLWQLPVLVLLPVVVLIVLGIVLHRYVRRRSAPGEERDWSVPPLADGAAGVSPLHRWDVRCKLVTILAYSFMVVSLGRLKPALAAVAISVMVLVISRASLAKVLMRLLAISGFIGMFFAALSGSASTCGAFNWRPPSAPRPWPSPC